MPCRHDTEPETNALYGCDGTCLVEQELEDRDAEPLSVCCHASPIDEIDENGIGFCSLCKEPVPFEVYSDESE